MLKERKVLGTKKLTIKGKKNDKLWSTQEVTELVIERNAPT